MARMKKDEAGLPSGVVEPRDILNKFADSGIVYNR